MTVELKKERTVGILAGNGSYPFLLAECLVGRGHRVAVAGIDGQFNGSLPDGCGPVSTFPLGAIKEVVEFFLDNDTKHIFMAGGVTRKGAWRSARPDLQTLRLVPHALLGGDDKLLKSVAHTISKLGAEICDPRPYIGDLISRAGLMAGPKPDAASLKDIEIAAKAARDLGIRDVGQSAIAHNGRVVGIEDRRGTDAMLAGAPGPGAVMAKVRKPGQDPRFDMPAIGPSTALAAHKAKLGAIAVEAGGVLLLEREKLFDICDDKRISLVGI
jgi:DUF1009 family protein